MSKYVVILKRAIPVEGCMTDTVTGVFNEKAPIGEIMKWADMHDGGSVALISIEITKPEVGSDE